MARYVGSVREACRQIRTVRAFAKQEQLKDVAAGLNLMEDKCDGMVTAVQQQIHAMGIEHDWERVYPEGEDPFKPLKPERVPTPEARKQENKKQGTTGKPETVTAEPSTCLLYTSPSPRD